MSKMVNKSSVNWKLIVAATAAGIVVASGIAYYIKTKKKKTLSKNVSDIDIECKVDGLNDDPLAKAINLKDRGNQYFKAGQYDKALEYYVKALNMCPITDKKERAKIFQNKAVALENMDRKDDALDNLNDALDLDPRYEKALNRRSKLYEYKGRLRDALVDITAASYFDDFRSQDYLLRMDILVKRIAQEEADLFDKTRDFSLPSSSYVYTYFESFPNDPLLDKDFPVEESGDTSVEILEKCLAMLRSKYYTDSFKEVREVLVSDINKSDETMSRLLLLRGTFYFLSCHEDMALEDFNRVINNKFARPTVTINALIKKALIMMSCEKIEESEAAFTEALQIDPKCADIYYHRGSLFEGTERFQEASNDFSKALELLPDYSFAAVHKAFNDIRLCNTNSLSFEEFEKILEHYPKSLECHLIYSQLLLNTGNFSEVKRVCEKYLKFESDSAPILMILAMAKLSQGEESEAKRLLNDAIKNDSKYPYAYQTLASVHMKDGDLQKSLELMEKAIPLAKNRSELLSFIATREGVRAQLSVSVMYRIPAAQLFASIMRSISPPGVV